MSSPLPKSHAIVEIKYFDPKSSKVEPKDVGWTIIPIFD
jgi:hypothetical protein